MLSRKKNIMLKYVSTLHCPPDLDKYNIYTTVALKNEMFNFSKRYSYYYYFFSSILPLLRRQVTHKINFKISKIV